MLRPYANRSAPFFVAVAFAQLLDLVTFLPAVGKVGIGAESNPIARVLYGTIGPMGPAALKAIAISIMLLALLRVARRFPTYVMPSAALMITIGLFGTASNVLFGLLR